MAAREKNIRQVFQATPGLSMMHCPMQYREEIYFVTLQERQPCPHRSVYMYIIINIYSL